MTTDDKTNMSRRTLLKAGAAASLTGLASGGVFAAGSDKPELETVKVGFIPLTDCASVVMAWPLWFKFIRIAMSFLAPPTPFWTP